MSFDYASVAATSLELLSEFGQNVTLRATTVGAYDPTTGATTNTTADTPRKGVLLDFGAGQTLERGTLIQGGDKRLLVDATGAVSPQDHFVVGGVEYVVISVGEVNPAGTRVLWDLHLRT
jgi:hypothetical protein